MKAERRMACGDGPLAPGDRFGVHVHAVVAACQVAGQAEGEIADSAPDVEHPVFRSQAATDQFVASTVIGPRERVRVPRAVVVDTKMGWRQQRATPPAHDAVERRRSCQIVVSPCC